MEGKSVVKFLVKKCTFCLHHTHINNKLLFSVNKPVHEIQIQRIYHGSHCSCDCIVENIPNIYDTGYIKHILYDFQ